MTTNSSPPTELSKKITTFEICDSFKHGLVEGLAECTECRQPAFLHDYAQVEDQVVPWSNELISKWLTDGVITRIRASMLLIRAYESDPEKWPTP